ncbi:MAG: AmmeMemoRadiSam system protein B [Nanoarchaeota archaeon]
MARKPVVAGKFYEQHPRLLREQIRQCFLHSKGPGEIKEVEEDKGRSVLGAVSPHAGYMFSGMCAAHVFKAIKDTGDYDTFFILGFSHSQNDSNEITITSQDWQTPLGKARLDKDFADKLLELDFVSEDDKAHEFEHSIEVQIPFLQYLYEDIKIVPLSIAGNCDIVRATNEIKKIIEGENKKVCFIASSDFTHYGPGFGYLPFSDNVKESLKKLDFGAIEKIKSADTKGFIDYVENTGATICGKQPIALLIELLKDDAVKIETLSYYTSGDILSDYTNAVSYAGIIFE